MYSEAEHVFQLSLSLWRNRPGDNKFNIGTVLNNLAVTYISSGQTQKAIETYEEVMEIMTGDPQIPAINLATCTYV
jgi:hypothetical protein